MPLLPAKGTRVCHSSRLSQVSEARMPSLPLPPLPPLFLYVCACACWRIERLKRPTIVAWPLNLPCRVWAASAAAKVYGKLAQAVVREVRDLKEKADTTPELVFDPSSKEFVINGSQRMSAVELRYRYTARESARQPGYSKAGQQC